MEHPVYLSREPMIFPARKSHTRDQGYEVKETKTLIRDAFASVDMISESGGPSSNRPCSVSMLTEIIAGDRRLTPSSLSPDNFITTVDLLFVFVPARRPICS